MQHVALIDPAGRVIREFMVHENLTEVELPAGIYFVRTANHLRRKLVVL
jgi:hypothetical protein